MTVDSSKANRSLREAIAAVQGGNRVRGRELLLDIVQQQRDLELAWWWLFRAVDEPREKMRALENVVRLNPSHQEAQQALTGLRQRQLLARGPADWRDKLPDSPLEGGDGIDDPYQCAYCGQPTGVDDRRCPHCSGNLYRRVARSRTSGGLRLLGLLLGISLGVGVLEALGPAYALGLALGAPQAVNLELIVSFFGVRQFLGEFLALPPPTARLLLQVYAVRGLLLLALLLGLRLRWTVAYYGMMLGLLADGLLSLYLLITGYLGAVGALLNAGLALTMGIVLFSVNYEFAVNSERLLVRPDTKARTALDFYQRGHAYRRRGLWALAVAQWRKAVGLAPHATRYYKDLGVGYAEIRRFDRSLRALAEAQRQAPHDAEIAKMISLVKARAEKDSLLRR